MKYKRSEARLVTKRIRLKKAVITLNQYFSTKKNNPETTIRVITHHLDPSHAVPLDGLAVLRTVKQ